MTEPTGQSWLAEIAAIAVVRGVSIASAESITVGLVQSMLGSRSGASGWFAGGVTAYNLEQKTRLLRVDADRARLCDCVSQRVADEMAANCRRLFGADLAVATTGYAEPPTGRKSSQPFAHLSLATGEGVVRQVEVALAAGDRRANQEACAWATIEMLAMHLRSLGDA